MDNTNNRKQKNCQKFHDLYFHYKLRRLNEIKRVTYVYFYIFAYNSSHIGNEKLLDPFADKFNNQKSGNGVSGWLLLVSE